MCLNLLPLQKDGILKRSTQKENDVELSDTTKADLSHLKVALQGIAGMKEEPLVASKQFNQQN